MTRRGLVFVLVAILIAGCQGASWGQSRADGPGSGTPAPSDVYPGPPVPVTPPCAQSPASATELGSPSEIEPAWFRSDGSTLYITARGFEHGGAFDPAVGQTAVYIGPASVQPQAQANGHMIGATHSLSLREKTFSSITLPAGGYWLTSSQGGDLLVIACNAGAISRQNQR